MLLKHLLVGLADESIPSALVCRPDCDVDSILSPGVEVIRHPVFDFPLLGRQNMKTLVERLASFKPTVLHCVCRSQAKLTMELARQLDLPYVLTANSLQERWRPLRICSAHCARVIVPAGSVGSDLVQVHPGFAERIRQINIGTFAAETSSCFRELGRLASVVTAYPSNSAGDIEKLLNAVRHLVIDGYEFILFIIGGDRAGAQLRKLLGALGLLWVVTIVPRLTAWRSILAAGDIFIQPRPNAAFDPLLLEAMSVGSAVAGCKGGVDDLIVEGQTAVVFDPDDELSIYGGLQQLFDRPEYARKLAVSAQQYVRENHSVSEMVAGILQAYRDAEQWYGR
jgi:glycosyltransferase involved in cell wall biosynthesis